VPAVVVAPAPTEVKRVPVSVPAPTPATTVPKTPVADQKGKEAKAEAPNPTAAKAAQVAHLELAET
jgi:hypothetical protein